MHVIERHTVDGETLARVLEGFPDRIGGLVHRMQHSESPEVGWRFVALDLLDYVGASSVADPALTGGDPAEALRSAFAATLGAVRLSAFGTASVMIDYVNEGVSHSTDPEGVDPEDWLDAFWLACLLGEDGRHAAELGEAAGHRRTVAPADDALIRALVAHRCGPPEGGQPGATGPRDPGAPEPRTALRMLEALSAGEEAEFTRALTARLEEHRERCADRHAAPRTLLPLDAAALTCLARRERGWRPAVASGYLPERLVAGVRPPGPRVGPFGRDASPQAVAARAAGPVVITRPPMDFVRGPSDFDASADRYVAEFRDPAEDALGLARLHGLLMKYHLYCFVLRAAAVPDGPDERRDRDLRTAAEAGAGCVLLRNAGPDGEAEVTVAGTTRTLPFPGKGRGITPEEWSDAVSAALILGDPGMLATLLTIDRGDLAHRYVRATTTYAETLHALLTGGDATGLVERSLARTAGAPQGPAHQLFRVLSQLAAGDATGFGLALADALEAHRTYYEPASRARDFDAGLSLPLLALACHARRQGWDVGIVSPYLPGFLGSFAGAA